MRSCFLSLSFILQATALSAAAPEHVNLEQLISEGRKQYRTAQYSKCLDSFKKAWEMSKASVDPDVHNMANDAGTELARMYSRIGEMEKLEATIKELRGRRLLGQAAQYFSDANNALANMKHLPQMSFKCGPYALDRILARGKNEHRVHDVIFKAESPSTGFSLLEVFELSKKVGMKMQLARRNNGGEVVVPAVVHWKVGHFAALVEVREHMILAEDPTFGEPAWLSRATLDEESSGEFLIPAGPLPSGWEKLSRSDAEKVFGKGISATIGDQPPYCSLATAKACPECSQGETSAAPDSGGTCCGGPGMPDYDFDLASTSLILRDEPIKYSVPYGPKVPMKLTYHSQNSSVDLNFTNFGRNWSFEWLSFIKVSTAGTFVDSVIKDGWAHYARGGGYENTGTWNGAHTILTGRYSRAALEVKSFQNVQFHDHERYCPPAATCLPIWHPEYDPDCGSDLYNCYEVCTSGSFLGQIPRSFERRTINGWKEEFNEPSEDAPEFGVGCDGYERKIFLTKLIDPSGNEIRLEYDALHRLEYIEDSLGQRTTFQYGGYLDKQVTRVTDPFGRSAEFTYDNIGRLTSIKDVIGLVTHFNYENADFADFISSMTTPYGTTKFKFAFPDQVHPVRELEVLDPAGNKERLTYDVSEKPADWSFAMPPGGLVHSDLVSYWQFRNSYYWDKKAMHDDPNSVASATNYHWLHTNDNPTRQSYILESMKPPQRSRIFYNYPGQTVPNDSIFEPPMSTGVLRPSRIFSYVSNESGAQTQRMEVFNRNSFGKITSHIDPKGRETSYEYSEDGVDLLAIRDGNDALLAGYSYNDAGLPLTHTDSSGHVTNYSYNSRGQLTLIESPTGLRSEFNYDERGYLRSTKASSGTESQFAWDNLGRRISTTNPSEGTVSYTYDNLDRVKKVSFSDGSYEESSYLYLDQVSFRDRKGRLTKYTYDGARRLTSIIDPLNQVTGFEWCDCGSLGALVDPRGNRTEWEYNRGHDVKKKRFADGSQFQYVYDEFGDGALIKRTDPKAQETHYKYFLDGQIASVSYVNEEIATPNVTYEYNDLNGNLKSMHDGSGTTRFFYHSIGAFGGGNLSSIDGPLDNDTIEYVYDEENRLISKNINDSNEQYNYGESGLLASVQNALGNFLYSYDSASRLNVVLFPNAQKVEYEYYDVSGLGRLKSIQNGLNGTLVSKFDYEYNAVGEITKWTQLQDGVTKVWDMTATDTYDAAGQLHKAVLQETGGNTNYQWDYDASGNRTGESRGSFSNTFTANNLNQLTTVSTDGFDAKGLTNRDATVSVLGQSANTLSDEFKLSVGPGTTQFDVKAIAADGAVTTNRYQVTNPQNLSYDANGNLVSDGSRTFEWDAEDRLLKITNAGHNPASVVEFRYDGLNQRVRQTEKIGANVISDTAYIWEGYELLEARNANTGETTKRYFQNGVQILTGQETGNFYYSVDHLGSVRQVNDAAGALRASYDFDLWGRSFKLAGDIDADLGFTGHFRQPLLGLELAPLRAYSPALGRWLSRDPLDIFDGLNLYAYVHNDPVNSIDPFGLAGQNHSCANMIQNLRDDMARLRRRGRINAAEIAMLMAKLAWIKKNCPDQAGQVEDLEKELKEWQNQWVDNFVENLKDFIGIGCKTGVPIRVR